MRRDEQYTPVGEVAGTALPPLVAST